MTQEVLFEMFEKLSQEGFELKVETKNNKRYISIVTNLPNEKKVISKNFTNFSPNLTKKNKKKSISKVRKNKKYFTPYMTFIKSIREKHPELSPKGAINVGKKFMKEYDDILKVSKKQFDETMSTVNFNYYK